MSGAIVRGAGVGVLVLVGCGTSVDRASNATTGAGGSSATTTTASASSSSSVSSGQGGGTDVAPGQVLAGQLDWPVSIAVDGAAVYWAESEGSAVKKVPLAGGPVTVLVAACPSFPWGLALDADHVYAALDGGGGILRVAKAGGPFDNVVVLSIDDQTQDLLADATHLYWDSASLNRVDVAALPSGATSTLATDDGAYGVNGAGLTMDATYVYWASGAAIKRVPKTGGPVVTVVTPAAAPVAFAVDATRAYWLADGAVWAAPLDGGATIKLASLPNPFGWQGQWLTVDDAGVYVAFSATSFSAHDGAVVRIPLAGGAPVVLASGAVRPSAITVDASHVYWTDIGLGTVSRAPKP
jgi:hypothetical protein